jgi:hypothetical protein
MKIEWIEISKIKLFNSRMISVSDLLLVKNDIPQTPLLVDENYNLLDNYIEYYSYLIYKKKMVPIIISSEMDNFYLNEDFSQAA